MFAKGYSKVFFAVLIMISMIPVVLLSCSENTVDNVDDRLFFESLSQDVRDHIYWFCDYESGTFQKWEDAGTENFYAGGGIFLSDPDNVDYGITEEPVHSGCHASFSVISNATSPGENKAVRFMRWTDKAWNENGKYFPDEAYYSVFMYFPKIYDPGKPVDNDPLGDGGWWNIFQFKSDNNAGSQPVVILDVYNRDGQMYFALVVKDYTNDGSSSHDQEYTEQIKPRKLPVRTWVHVEAFYKKSKDYTGEVIIWQNGFRILERSGIRTVLPPGETATWGIGSYSDFIKGPAEDGTAIVYFDDACVAAGRIGMYIEAISRMAD